MIPAIGHCVSSTLGWRESRVLCCVAACRVSAVIWLKCVRNVIWAHLIYFIHWQPIWPGLSAILQFQLAHNLPWPGAGTRPGLWLVSCHHPWPLIGWWGPSPVTMSGLSLHAWRGSTVQLCMTSSQARPVNINLGPVHSEEEVWNGDCRNKYYLFPPNPISAPYMK